MNEKYLDIRSLQRVRVQWANELYVVKESTYHVDRLRECWICGGKFKIGDGMTLMFTNVGNKTVHTACYKEQEGEKSDQEN